MSEEPSPAETAKRLKRKFIEDALLEDSVRDATAHDWHKTTVGPVFKEAKTETEKEQKKEFKKALREELRSLARQYEGKDMDTDTHIQNILGLAERLGKRHSGILHEDKLVFGIAAKALDVYLKYLHCANFDVRPPHCPFDYGIVDELNPKGDVERRWTFCDKQEDYREWVRLAKEAAKRDGFDSVTDWETVTWDEQQRED